MNTNRFRTLLYSPPATTIMTGVCLLAFLILWNGNLVSASAELREPGSPSDIPVPVSEMYDMQLETEMLEQQYDRVISDALDRYFDRGSYMARTSLDIERQQVRLIEPGEQPDEPAEEVAPVRIPGVPYVPAFVERERSFAEEMAALIGQSYTRTVINQIRVDLSLDVGYSEEEIAFMEEIIRSAARLQDTRDDRIEVTLISFPGPEFERQAAKLEERAAELEQKQQEQDSGQQASVEGNALPDIAAIGSMLSDAEGRRTLAGLMLANPAYLLLSVFVLIMVLALLILFILLFRGIPVRTKGARKAYAGGDDTGSTPNVTSSPTSGVRSSTPADPPVRDRSETDNSGMATGYRDGSFMRAETMPSDDAFYFSGLISAYPADMARYVEKRIASGEERAGRQIAAAFHMIDHKMVRLLEPYMSRETIEELRKEISTADGQATDYSDAAITSLITYLKSCERPDSYLFKIQPLKDFEFIRHVSPGFFGTLVSGLKDIHIALIAAHMPKDTTQQWLAEQDEGYIQRLMQVMPQVQEISYKEYALVAERLFDLHESQKESGAYPQQLVHEMVELIERMPVDRQQGMIRALSDDDNEYNRRILSQLVTLEDVLKLPADVISRVLENMEAETIAMACTSLTEEQRAIVLKSRTDREMSVITNLIRSKGETYSGKMVSEARLQIVREARPFI